MKEQISALLDGELEDDQAQSSLDALKQSGDARAAWHDYALIGDVLRGEPVLSVDFQAALMQRLEEEPTVLAPAALSAAPAGRKAGRPFERYLAMAAGLAGVGLVGWMALQFAPGLGPAQVAVAPPAVKAATAIQTADAQADRAYLMAHQAYASGQAAPGVAYYIRTVSDQPGDAAR